MLDFFKTSNLLTPEQRMLQQSTRKFLEEVAAPHIKEWWENGVAPVHLAKEFGRMGLLGANLPQEYGAPGADNISYGLIMYEFERIDSSLRSFASVMGGLSMYAIYAYGDEAQKKAYLPDMAKGELTGCFGLTEHEGGSDPGAMKTHVKADGDDFILNGVKVWISNGNFADIAVVWAKDEEGVVRGFIVPTKSKGFQANEIKHKLSLRAWVTSELVLTDVRVPRSAMLPKAEGLRAPLGCLTQARYGIAWGSMGALEAIYEEALAFAKQRFTFGKAIAARQLVQDKLVQMLSDHTRGFLLAWRLGQLKDMGEMTPFHVSLAKRENVRTALAGARVAREILGGPGITLDYCAIRHMLNLESVDTYEGTHDIHTLILGRQITGLDALQ